MKKVLSWLLSLLLVLSIFSSAIAAKTPVYLGSASAVEEVRPAENLLMYSYTGSISATLSFSGNIAYCSGTVSPSGTYSASITVKLYKQSGTSWAYITSWSGSATGGGVAGAGGSITVSSGTYMVKSFGNIGNGLEYPVKSVTRTN